MVATSQASRRKISRATRNRGHATRNSSAGRRKTKTEFNKEANEGSIKTARRARSVAPVGNVTSTVNWWKKTTLLERLPNSGTPQQRGYRPSPRSVALHHSERKGQDPAGAMVLVGGSFASTMLTRETQAMDELSMIVFNAAYWWAANKPLLKVDENVAAAYLCTSVVIYFVFEDLYWLFIVLFGPGWWAPTLRTSAAGTRVASGPR